MKYEINNFNMELHGEQVTKFYYPFWVERTNTADMYVDTLQIEALEKHNLLVSALGYEEGELLAAYLGVISPCLFDYRKTASHEMLWALSPKKRGGRNFLRFIEAIEEANKNIDTINLTVPVENTTAPSALPRLGFAPQDCNFVKNKETP